MTAAAESDEVLTVVAPTLSRARAALGSLPPDAAVRAVPHSLSSLLRSRARVSRVVLCPSGRSVPEDVAFLREARRRLLWIGAPADSYEAISGLLTHLPPREQEAHRPRARRRRSGPILLLEGTVHGRRVRSALASDARHWIVERVECVRLSEATLEALAREGVRWSVLFPIRVTAVLASRRLARARRKWIRLLPPGTAVWVVEKTKRKNRRRA